MLLTLTLRRAPLALWSALFLLLQIADVLVTLLALPLGAREANPLAHLVATLASAPLPVGVVVAKVLGLCVMVVAFAGLTHWFPQLARAVVRPYCLVSMVLVAWNCVVLLHPMGLR